MAFFKDNQALLAAPLAPATPLLEPTTPQRHAAAVLYNRIGGLLDAAAAAVGLRTPMLAAAWLVESSGATHVPGHAIIRFEAHLFFAAWGKSHPADFDAHFQFGGHADVPGHPWQNQQFRAAEPDPFRPFHGDQA